MFLEGLIPLLTDLSWNGFNVKYKYTVYDGSRLKCNVFIYPMDRYEWYVPLTLTNQETQDWSTSTKDWLNRDNSKSDFITDHFLMSLTVKKTVIWNWHKIKVSNLLSVF